MGNRRKASSTIKLIKNKLIREKGLRSVSISKYPISKAWERVSLEMEVLA